ncbi:hypothetical protein PR048_002805 [Dryococelus australis]|uniref:Ribosomal protein S3 n=1 Tax=Dryococelus australis TaxID=614101 RepID=A0ABQ9IMN5_9NEOP|nr:hypothetical protein PR048_002805 [Dryococelus australis]
MLRSSVTVSEFWSREASECKAAEETGDPRGNPPINGIVRHDSHVGKSGTSPRNILVEAVTWQQKEDARRRIELEFNSAYGVFSRSLKTLKVKYDTIERSVEIILTPCSASRNALESFRCPHTVGFIRRFHTLSPIHATNTSPAVVPQSPVVVHTSLRSRTLGQAASVKDRRPLDCGSTSQSHQNILASSLNVSEYLTSERRWVAPASLAAVGINGIPGRTATGRQRIVPWRGEGEVGFLPRRGVAESAAAPRYKERSKLLREAGTRKASVMARSKEASHYSPVVRTGNRTRDLPNTSGAVVTRWTRSREDPGSIPGPAILISTFHGISEITPGECWDGSQKIMTYHFPFLPQFFPPVQLAPSLMTSLSTRHYKRQGIVIGARRAADSCVSTLEVVNFLLRSDLRISGMTRGGKRPPGGGQACGAPRNWGVIKRDRPAGGRSRYVFVAPVENPFPDGTAGAAAGLVRKPKYRFQSASPPLLVVAYFVLLLDQDHRLSDITTYDGRCKNVGSVDISDLFGTPARGQLGEFRSPPGTPQQNPGHAWQGKREIPEKTRRPAPSSGTIPTCENTGVTRQVIEISSPWWEASNLPAQQPWPLEGIATRGALNLRDGPGNAINIATGLRAGSGVELELISERVAEFRAIKEQAARVMTSGREVCDCEYQTVNDAAVKLDCWT